MLNCGARATYLQKCQIRDIGHQHPVPSSSSFIPEIRSKLVHDQCTFDQLVCSNAQLNFVSLDLNPPYSIGLKASLSVVTLTLALISLLANAAVVWIILRHRVMHRQTTNRLVLNLAISDMSIALFNTIPLGLYNIYEHWVLPDWLCPVNQMLGVTPFCVSVFTMVVMSIDRYFAILHPLECRPWGQNGSQCCVFTISAIWTISFLFGMPALYLYDSIDNIFLISGGEVLNWTRTACDVLPHKQSYNLTYNASLVVLQFLIPFAVLLFTYGHIACELWSERREMPNNNFKESFLHAKRRMAKLFAILVFSFLLLWLPYELLFAVPNDLFVGGAHLQWKVVLNTTFLLAMSSTIVSPLVYYHMSERFNAGFRYAFDRILPQKARISTQEYRTKFGLDGPRISLIFGQLQNDCATRRQTCDTTVASTKGSVQLY